MTSLFPRLTLFGLAALVALAGCDGDDPVDCAVTPNDPSCPSQTATVYQTDFTFQGEAGTRVEDRGEGTGTTTWTSDTVYFLDGFVFVNSGQTLTIEAGTVIKGLPGDGEDASAFIVARGGRVEANGSASAPIIFTAATDDVSDPNDIPEGTRGLWGGVIVLGNARLNSTPGTTAIEGIPTTEARGLYGGSDDADNSGTLRYVSIRYGGTDIGAGNEINGLTFGGVGSGTTVDYIEVFGNADDGVEWFGGTVNTKHLAVAFVGDDAFDYDEGFRGNGQFWFTIQSTDANRAGEHDGGTDPEDGTPYAIPVIANATYIGSGVTSGNADNDRVLEFRDNAGGTYYASLFTDFADGALRIEDLVDDGVEDSRKRFEAGDLELVANWWFGFGAGDMLPDVIDVTKYDDDDDDTTPEVEVDPDFRNVLVNYLVANGNAFGTDPMLGGISRSRNGGLNPVPMGGSPLLSANPTLPSGAFFEQVGYIGAFGNTNWLQGWTALSQLGYLAN